MSIDSLLDRDPRWQASGSATHPDTVVLSVCNTSRNLGDQPFPGISGSGAREAVEERLLAVFETLGLFESGEYFRLPALQPAERQLLAERQLIPPAMITPRRGQGVYVSHDQCLGILVNDENHCCIRVLAAGLSPRDAWARAGELDDRLNSLLDFAYSPQWGFLTRELRHAGTGLRMSLLMHLPACAHESALADAGVLQAIGYDAGNRDLEFSGVGTGIPGAAPPPSREGGDPVYSQALYNGMDGFASRGLYETEGDLFQLRNRSTLGHSEDELVLRLKQCATDIVRKEVELRDRLREQYADLLEDRVERARALATSARLIPFDESFTLLSSLRLGVTLGLISDRTVADLNGSLIHCQGAHLQRQLQPGADTVDGLSLKRLRARQFKKLFTPAKG